MDEFESQLNASSPRIQRSATIDRELDALATTAERANKRRHTVIVRGGIAAALIIVVLAGTGAALASPAVRLSLGLLQQPSVTVRLPISHCKFTSYMRGGAGPVALTAHNLAALQFAAAWISRVDLRRVEETNAFAVNYFPVDNESPPVAPTAAEEKMFAASAEVHALADVLAPKLKAAATRRGVDSSILEWRYGALDCTGGTK